ncbi:uncharacterized protein AC631_01944 [Debaryomyces fabryi]|uniref:CNH domain-containing protein n=1 Tax=Debaryomyces fabryi TaxID=58627 RepID=A0A0V1Q1L6_9ASCO|nr:uncharacterized protein AC631_01944 [Debaryomyces fabryi]KSA02294.1 hypothetical protein AC631_01944 [Debaryomyces fabryi]CUM47265.1 unnamed protein product [Debaryomyces fabryi]
MNINVIRPLTWLHLQANQKISAVNRFNDKLFLGLTEGDLKVYSIKPSKEEPSDYPDNIRQTKSFNDTKSLFNNNDQLHIFNLETSFKNTTGNNTAIDRIHIISNASNTNDKERYTLIISNLNLIRIYEFVGTSLNLIEEVEDPKGYVDYISVRMGQQTLLITAAKKTLTIYELKRKSRNIFLLQKLEEIILKDKIKALHLLPQINRNQVIIGLLSDFLIVDLENNFKIYSVPFDEMNLGNFMHTTSFSYFGLSKTGPEIRIISVSNEEVLLIKDTQAAKLNIEGESSAVVNTPVKFLLIPLFVACFGPCYLLVVYNKRMEIIDIQSGDLIQKFQHNINSNYISGYYSGNDIFLGSGLDLLHFSILDYQKQVHQYLNYKEPTGFKRNIRDINSDLKLLGITKSISLVSRLNNENEFFNKNNGSNEKNKQLLLRDLYKSKALILFESYSKYHEALVEIASDWIVSYKDILPLFPDFLNAEKQINDVAAKNTSHEPSSNVVNKISLEDILSTSLGHTTTADSATDYDLAESPNFERTSTESLKGSKSVPEHSKSTNIRKFNKAVSNLIIYFTEQRRIHANFFNSDSDSTPSIKWKGIDITPYDIYPSLDPDNLENQLNQIVSIIDTALFLCYYYTKPMLLGPLLRLPNNKCDTKIVHKCLLANLHQHSKEPSFIKELLDFYYGRGLHKDALEMLYKLAHENTNDHNDDFDEFLRGPALTVQYLQKLNGGDLALIFEFAEWVIKENDETAFKDAELIFMNDSYECESYDHYKVLEFLVNTIKNDSIAVRYLEWLLFESEILKKAEPNKTVLKFHTKLCLLYLKKIIEIQSEDEDFAASQYYIKLSDMLKNTTLYEPWTVLNAIPKTEDMFLRLTTYIYKRLGEHDKAIDVLFNQLEDLDSAMKYCSDVYYQPHNKQTGERLLHKLLDDLLQHTSENISSIEKLLYTQGSKMSILRILTSLPNSFPLYKLEKFLSQQLRSSMDSVHDTNVASQLYKVGSTKLQDKLQTIQSEGYTVESGKQLCTICNRKLGYSVLSVGKDKQIAHYGCYQREQIDTI